MPKVIGSMHGGGRSKLREFECKAPALNNYIHISVRNSSSREVQRKQSLILIERIGGKVGSPLMGRLKVEKMLGLAFEG